MAMHPDTTYVNHIGSNHFRKEHRSEHRYCPGYKYFASANSDSIYPVDYSHVDDSHINSSMLWSGYIYTFISDGNGGYKWLASKPTTRYIRSQNRLYDRENPTEYNDISIKSNYIKRGVFLVRYITKKGHRRLPKYIPIYRVCNIIEDPSISIAELKRIYSTLIYQRLYYSGSFCDKTGVKVVQANILYAYYRNKEFVRCTVKNNIIKYVQFSYKNGRIKASDIIKEIKRYKIRNT